MIDMIDGILVYVDNKIELKRYKYMFLIEKKISYDRNRRLVGCCIQRLF